MPFTLHTHEYSLIPGTTESRLVRATPYVRLRGEGAPAPLFVQSGQVYSENGQRITDIPEWFWVEVRKMSPAARAEVGLSLPDEAPLPPPAPHTPPQEIVQPGGSQTPSSMSYEQLEEYLGIRQEPDPEDDGPLPEPDPKMWLCTEVEGCTEVVPLSKKGVHIAKHRRQAKGLK